MGTTLEIFSNGLTADRADMVRCIAQSVTRAHSGITSSIKWQKLTFALDDDYHHWLCQVGATKHAIVLYFHFGGMLNDSSQLFQPATSEYVRKIEYHDLNDIDQDAIGDYVRQAIETLAEFKKRSSG